MIVSGFKQTPTHVSGKKSFHPIGVFTGQPIAEFDGDLDALLEFMGKVGLDAVEIGTWALDLRRADTDEGARVYAQEIIDRCKKQDLFVSGLAAHLQGQCLGDRATVKTCQFQGGEVEEAYKAAVAAGFVPPEDDPYAVPVEVAELSRQVATRDLIAVGRLAQYIGKLTDRSIPVSAFVGSAGAWDEIFDFPPRPSSFGGVDFPDRIEQALSVIIKRFKEVWDDYKRRGVKFGLESHPSEIGAGDIESTRRFLAATDAAGFNGTVGINFDASHMVWQNVDPIEFIFTFAAYIWSVHHKGVQVRNSKPSRAGVLGGFLGFGVWTRGWDFVFASSPRDATNPQEIIVALNQIGWDGVINLELEDNDFSLMDCMKRAVDEVWKVDLTPSPGAFDRAFAASKS